MSEIDPTRVVDANPTPGQEKALAPVEELGALGRIPKTQAERDDGTFLKTWLHGKSFNTVRGYKKFMRKFYDQIGKRLIEVKVPDIQAFEDSMAHQAVATQQHGVCAVKSALTFGQKVGYLPVNVGAAVKVPKGEDQLAERIMSEADVARVLALETDPRNHAILITLYRAGLRAAKLCDLEWKNVIERDEGAQLNIFGKGRRTRHVRINQETWEEIRSLKPANATPDTKVFQSAHVHYHNRFVKRSNPNDKRRPPTFRPDGRIDEVTLRQIVKQAGKRAGLPKLSPHWFRHAHASHALDRGAPPPLVRDTLGHSSIATTDRYSHARPKDSSARFLAF